MKTLIKIIITIALVPLAWIAFVRTFMSFFKIDFENFLDEEDF